MSYTLFTVVYGVLVLSKHPMQAVLTTCKRIRDASIYTSKKYRSSFYS